MKKLFYFISYLFMFNACNNRDNLIYEYYPDGSIKSSYSIKDGKKDGICREFFMNGKLKKICSYIQDKPVGYEREYDEFGLLRQVTLLNLLPPDSILFFWDYTMDSINVEQKESVIDCIWSYDENGELDSINSNFFQIKEELGDSICLYVYLSCPFFKDEDENNINYDFLFKTSMTNDSIFKHTTKNPYTKFCLKNSSENVKINFIIIENNNEQKKLIEYRGFHIVGEKENVYFPKYSKSEEEI